MYYFVVELIRATQRNIVYAPAMLVSWLGLVFYGRFSAMPLIDDNEDMFLWDPIVWDPDALDDILANRPLLPAAEYVRQYIEEDDSDA